MKRNIFIALLISFISYQLNSQETIVFVNDINYEEGLAKASEEGRPIMYYFHSDYCYECVTMDSMMMTTGFHEYFNQSFYNIKIDYKQPIGERLRKKFKIRYLPSIVLQNEEEGVIFVLDEDLSSKEILQHAEWTQNPRKHGNDFVQALNKKQRMTNYERVDELFDFSVVDNFVVEKENETTLFNQSHLHKFLNDGLANEHFEKYMKTQEDWGTDKNMQMIMDFLDDTRSGAFNFLMLNREKFNEKFGKDVIDKFIEDLIYTRLYQLQIPPDYNETVSLLQILDPENSDLRTYDYLIDLKLKTRKIPEYLFLERKFIKKFVPNDHERMNRMCQVHLREIPDNLNTEYYIDQSIIANKLNPNNIDYLYTLSRLYIKNGDKCGALNAAVRAYSLAMKNHTDPNAILKLILEIDKMYGVLDAP